MDMICIVKICVNTYIPSIILLVPQISIEADSVHALNFSTKSSFLKKKDLQSYILFSIKVSHVNNQRPI